MVRSDNGGNSLFRELKRRRVFRTSILYIAGCWLIVQMSEILFTPLGLDWDDNSRTLLIAAIIGFPIVLAISWFVQVSSKGLVRTSAFVERRVLNNIPPINERRHYRLTQYFSKDEVLPEYEWVLSAETGSLAGLSFGVNRTLVLGRALDCDVAIVSQHVSRQHARLDLDDNELTIEDLGSSNGTVVNGKVVSGVHVLRHDDELRLHNIIFRVTQSYSSSRNETEAMNQTRVINANNLDSEGAASEPSDV